MKKNTAFRFALYSFLISVFVNTAVVAPHILTAREFTPQQSFNIILLCAGISAVIFAVTCTIIYISSILFSKMKSEAAFWLLMIIGITAAVLTDTALSSTLAKFNEQTAWISAIAGFSIMVSLASQYQLFKGDEDAATVQQ